MTADSQARQTTSKKHQGTPNDQQCAEDQLEQLYIQQGQNGDTNWNPHNSAEQKWQQKLEIEAPAHVTAAMIWPVSAPKTAMAAASWGSTVQTQNDMATRLKANPDSPWTKPATIAPIATK